MQSKQTRRPFDPRLDGVVGDAGETPSPGGIFGQRPSPANQYGIFEAFWAIPAYVENEAIQGGVLDPYTLQPDLETALPIERNITGGVPSDDNLVSFPSYAPDVPQVQPATTEDTLRITPPPKAVSWKPLAILAALVAGAIVLTSGD